jgi:hypothetical protein
MGLLDGQIQSIIGTAVDFVLLDATLTQVSGDDPSDYVPGTGITPVETDYACRGFVEDDVQRYLDSGIISKGDRVVMLTQTSLGVTPMEGDKITIRGFESTVLSIGQDPAQATWVLGVSP